MLNTNSIREQMNKDTFSLSGFNGKVTAALKCLCLSRVLCLCIWFLFVVFFFLRCFKVFVVLEQYKAFQLS